MTYCRILRDGERYKSLAVALQPCGCYLWKLMLLLQVTSQRLPRQGQARRGINIYHGKVETVVNTNSENNHETQYKEIVKSSTSVL